MFTKEELTNIGKLIQSASITGRDSITVAVLLQKIEKLINPPESQKEKDKK